MFVQRLLFNYFYVSGFLLLLSGFYFRLPKLRLWISAVLCFSYIRLDVFVILKVMLARQLWFLIMNV